MAFAYPEPAHLNRRNTTHVPGSEEWSLSQATTNVPGHGEDWELDRVNTMQPVRPKAPRFAWPKGRQDYWALFKFFLAIGAVVGVVGARHLK